SYDVVTARAVGRLSTLAELASPLLREGGVLVAWKGKRDSEEEAEMERATAALAMRPERILEVGDRAGSRHRHLHVLRKTGATPKDLPRRAGVAKKRPKGRA
ncbi:MAG TPA: RsmG family class I SAM-dependent methyltransferase, partial [Thermoanaerobaculia bacterium]|nr:RsmG family class I SAM-dependent methyltransferase [Thermoanaerobaculia bacterium]